MTVTNVTNMGALQDILVTGTKLERPTGTEEIVESQVGNVHVTEVYAFPEETLNATRADVHFVKVGLTEGFPNKEEFIHLVRSAMDEGVFANTTADELATGPSYITLGGWLGSQDLALRFIGAVELVGIAQAITPGLLGIEGDAAAQMAGAGWVLLGPSTVWAND